MMTRSQWLEAYRQDALSTFEAALGDLAQAKYGLNKLMSAVRTAIDLDRSAAANDVLSAALQEAQETIDWLK